MVRVNNNKDIIMAFSTDFLRFLRNRMPSLKYVKMAAILIQTTMISLPIIRNAFGSPCDIINRNS